MTRNYKFDNLRCFLIFTVVFGHFLEGVPGVAASNIYKIIYSFHMPAFVFLTGCFASFKPKKIFYGLVYPYIVFQTIYLIYNYFVIHNAETFVLQYTSPYWLLWYLAVCIMYYLLIPFIDVKDGRKKVVIVFAAFAVSILSGYDTTFGYYLSLARFCAFLPFFILGYYFGHSEKINIECKLKHKTVMLLSVCALCVALIYLNIPKTVLHRSYCYGDVGGTVMQRVFLTVAALCWIVFLISAMPNKKVPSVSEIGRNTMPIFLFHGFITRLAVVYHMFVFSQGCNIALAIVCTAVILLIFGNRRMSKLFGR